MVRNAYRQDNSVIIQWDSETANILGFRVVYRLFGDKSFKQGPPLEASEREFKIKNVPSQVSTKDVARYLVTKHNKVSKRKYLVFSGMYCSLCHIPGGSQRHSRDGALLSM